MKVKTKVIFIVMVLVFFVGHHLIDLEEKDGFGLLSLTCFFQGWSEEN